MTRIESGPMDDRDAALEASIRLKLDRGEPLNDEERAFFARMPADKDAYISP